MLRTPNGISHERSSTATHTRSSQSRDGNQLVSQPSVTRLAKGLGWFSIGLGLTQLLAPRAVARMAGIRDDGRTRGIMLACGIREVASGVGILRGESRAPWVWTRVAGDLADLALLGVAKRQRKPMTASTVMNAVVERITVSNVATAMTAVGVITALDAFTAQRLSQSSRKESRPQRRAAAAKKGNQEVSHQITIDRPQEEVFRFWRDFNNLPRFMAHLQSVEVLDNRRSRWTAYAPAGKTVQWEAQIIADQPYELISWESMPGADIANSGTVRFVPAPGDRGTEIHVRLRYDAPAGKLGVALAKLFGREPSQQVKGDLYRLKQVLETGAVVQSDASIHRGPHPARPSHDQSHAMKQPTSYETPGSMVQDTELEEMLR